MKTVGIIGGLGPKTTSEFYLKIISECQRLNRVNRPPILISNIPAPYNIGEAIEKGKGEERFVPFLLRAAKQLERGGADFLVMPCNSLHYFIKDIKDSVKIPVLDIIGETTNFLKKKDISKVGLISTSITKKRRLYEKSFKSNGIELIVPNETQQKKIGEIIYRLVTGKHKDKDKKQLYDIIEYLNSKGALNIVLACTDLQLLKPRHPKVKIYDTMKIFAEATVREILK